MARPKKTSATSEEAAGVHAFQSTYGDPLPARIDLLQETICALLNRMRCMDEEAARQVAVFIRVLAARCVYWEKIRTVPQGHGERAREWNEYRDLLCEIALGKKTKRTHCNETILDQGRLLDQYLEHHRDFSTCQNATTRGEWIRAHESEIIDLLSVLPCFCTYGDALAVSGPFKNMLKKRLSRGQLRDFLLSLLHCTTPSQIAKIRKGPSSFTSDELLYRPLPDVIEFPF